MSINRRKFTQLAAWGGISAATTGIFFPKPAETYHLRFSLNSQTSQAASRRLLKLGRTKAVDRVFPLDEVSSLNVFDNVLSSTDLSLLGETLPPVGRAISSTVESTENEFIRRDFVQNRTPFARVEPTVSPGILWGRQRQERLGPNAGFASVQVDREYGEIITASFSGATTIGMDGAISVLASERLDPGGISRRLIPTRVQFEDWGTWEGDEGSSSGVSLTSYRTRLGEVFRRYQLVEPGSGGFGIIEISIEAELEPRRLIVMQVQFV